MLVWHFFLLFGTPVLLYFVYRSCTQLKYKKMYQRFATSPFPEDYKKVLSQFRPYQYLTQEEKKRFETKVQIFLSDKYFNGVGELIISDEMKLLVAAEACLLITNVPGPVYPGLKNIYLMEDVFIPKDNPVNAMTGLPTHEARLGEAWKRGPVVLSWRSIKQGSSVIFHEFSHQLDQQDGSFDGTPELGKNGNYDRWAQVMGREFIKLRQRIQQHKRSDIDTYGATNEAEFFAVVSEYYFTRAKKLKDNHPEVYEIFNDYFKLNPLRWDA